MRVLIDTNIVLDFLLQREPFFQDAELLFQAIDAELLRNRIEQFGKLSGILALDLVSEFRFKFYVNSEAVLCKVQS